MYKKSSLYIYPFFVGIQQSPAVGLAISELILDGDFQTIDLTRLGFDRILLDKPMYEFGIYWTFVVVCVMEEWNFCCFFFVHIRDQK